MPKFTVGQSIPPLDLQNIHGGSVSIPAPNAAVTHLQFRRFAGCPICNLHLRSIVRRHREIVAAGIREVVVFHSTAEAMMPYQGELPFATIADPDKTLYRLFGVESSLRSVADPRAWLAGLHGVLVNGPGGTTSRSGSLGLPADFLISASGRVTAVNYGRHANDQWSVDSLLALHQETQTHPQTNRVDA